MFLTGIGMFGVFLFLNYYLQEILRYSPVMTGVAFLPMVAALMITATISTTQLYPRMGARILVIGRHADGRRRHGLADRDQH